MHLGYSKRNAVKIALLLIIGFLIKRSSDYHTDSHASPSTSIPGNQESPRLIRYMDRYKVFDWLQLAAVLATLWTVVLAYQALRSADDQISIARQQNTLAQRQAQPSFTITMKADLPRVPVHKDILGRTTRLLWDINKNGIPDTLTIKTNGNAENTVVNISSSVVFRSPTDFDLYDLVPVYFWKHEGKDYSKFVADPPEANIVFEGDEGSYDIISIMTIDYEDVFHQLQTRYFLIPAHLHHQISFGRVA